MLDVDRMSDSFLGFLNQSHFYEITEQPDAFAVGWNGSGGELNGSTNHTPTETGGGDNFFDTYFSVPRFSVETALALVAAVLNALILAAVKNARISKERFVYNTLFANLAISDILCCALSWLCNNIFFLFSAHLSIYRQADNICQLFVYLVAAVFVGNGFGIVSTLTMLGFTTVQYLAICRPFQNTELFKPKRVACFIACSWILCIFTGFLPFFILLGLTRGRRCEPSMLITIMDWVTYGSNVAIAVLGLIYITIVALCITIYTEIRKVLREMGRFRYEQQEFNAERKAFVTIIILLFTLTFFFIPFSVLYVVTLNSQDGMAGLGNALIYYMNLLPYLKFLSDPIIYGVRMREARRGLLLLTIKCRIKRRSSSLVETNTGRRAKEKRERLS